MASACEAIHLSFRLHKKWMAPASARHDADGSITTLPRIICVICGLLRTTPQHTPASKPRKIPRHRPHLRRAQPPGDVLHHRIPPVPLRKPLQRPHNHSRRQPRQPRRADGRISLPIHPMTRSTRQRAVAVPMQRDRPPIRRLRQRQTRQKHRQRQNPHGAPCAP